MQIIASESVAQLAPLKLTPAPKRVSRMMHTIVISMAPANDYRSFQYKFRLGSVTRRIAVFPSV